MRFSPIAIALALVACTPPAPLSFAARGVASLETSSDPHVVEFFRVDTRYQSSCRDCVLVEILEDRKRQAVYLYPEPACALRPTHSLGTEARPQRGGGYTVMAVLNETGRRELARCTDGLKPEDAALFVVVVAEKALGTVFLSEFNADPEHAVVYFRGSELLREVERVLSRHGPEVEPI